MKLHFEPNLDYQHAAVEAVCDLFRGQETCRNEFTVIGNAGPPQGLPGTVNGFGPGNCLHLRDDDILANLNDIQLRNGLPPSQSLISGDFTVEMETGTGKTYVYLRTVFELNRRYGFSKFAIVVPSVAIKEGVYKTLQITEEHFRGLYAGVPFDYFLYDSGKLGQLRNFADSAHIQIMIVTVGAINKKSVNNLYKRCERTGGEKPIDLLRAMRPILIVDEPQSVDGGLQGQGRQALEAMNPLCTLRYSATHVDGRHMVYRLDAVDAYQRNLVKQIEVASACVESAHNQPYVRLLAVRSKGGAITAKVELELQTDAGLRRRARTVRDGDNLESIAARSVYHDCRVGEICSAKGRESLELHLPGGVCHLQAGQAHGGVEPLALQREMIRRTIEEHFDKELRLTPLGIKVLSLFFIDAVERYRKYDGEGNPMKGDYALVFEEEFRRLASQPGYQTLFKDVDVKAAAAAVHEGYFSIDRKRMGAATVEVFKNTRGDTKADNDTYSLIMRKKEELLSFSSPLKFIFSHSALKEGWDNPNVFQICALRDMGTERERRQTIGRGLRLCVNQHGQRLRGGDINTLTVIATEGVEQFAENLQKEIEADTGIRFGIVEKHQFAAIPIAGQSGGITALGVAQSEAIWAFLKDAGYLDSKGRIQAPLRSALKNGAVQLPEEFAAQWPAVEEILRKRSGKLEVRNADERKNFHAQPHKLRGEEASPGGNAMKRPGSQVWFDNERLIEKCVEAIRDIPPITGTRMHWHKAELIIGRVDVEATGTATSAPVALDEGVVELPDLLTDLEHRTQLTRRSLVRILTSSGRLDDFMRNPGEFLERTAQSISHAKRQALPEGMRQRRNLGGACEAKATGAE